MDIQFVVIWLVIGAIAGWLAGIVMKGTGYGVIGDGLGRAASISRTIRSLARIH